MAAYMIAYRVPYGSSESGPIAEKCDVHPETNADKTLLLSWSFISDYKAGLIDSDGYRKGIQTANDRQAIQLLSSLFII